MVDALRLEVRETVGVIALGPRRLLISRQGELHFRAVAVHGPPDPWPLTVRLTEAAVKERRLPLSVAAGRNMCRGAEAAQKVPAIIIPSASMVRGEAPSPLKGGHSDPNILPSLNLSDVSIAGRPADTSGI